MSEFKNAQVTLKGNVLLSKALTGEQLTFTKIVMGDGSIGSNTIMGTTQLINPIKELSITKLTRKENVVTVGTVLSLGEINPFYWRELGLYAKGSDGVEVLYMYGNAGSLASYISNGGLNEKLIDINVVVGNASSVSAIIDDSLVFLTADDLNNHDNDENAHNALKVWVLNLFSSGDWAKYSQAEDIQKRIGASGDDNTKSTLFGFLSGIKSKIGLLLDATISSRAPADTALSKSTWTDARAVKLDNIGATGDTGGSATTGTVMAKLNAILTWFTGTWTATRAAKLDQLDTILAKLGAGDYAGKELMLYGNVTFAFGTTWTYSNSQGGILILLANDTRYSNSHSLIVDGVTKYTNCGVGMWELNTQAEGGSSGYSTYKISIPFTNSIQIVSNAVTSSNFSFTLNVIAYLNK